MKTKSIQFNFSKKNVLIVGGSRGFGAALVSNFVKSNANVYYISRNLNTNKEGSHISVDLSDTKDLLLAL